MEVRVDEPGVKTIKADLSNIETVTQYVKSAIGSIKFTMNWKNCKDVLAKYYVDMTYLYWENWKLETNWAKVEELDAVFDRLAQQNQLAIDSMYKFKFSLQYCRSYIDKIELDKYESKLNDILEEYKLIIDDAIDNSK